MTQIVELADTEFETVRKLFKKYERWHGLSVAEQSAYWKLFGHPLSKRAKPLETSGVV